jgi:hypothetical protein
MGIYMVFTSLSTGREKKQNGFYFKLAQSLNQNQGSLRMKHKDKFKQTEIGIIPEDWNIIKIGDVARINEVATSIR